MLLNIIGIDLFDDGSNRGKAIQGDNIDSVTEVDNIRLIAFYSPEHFFRRTDASEFALGNSALGWVEEFFAW